MASIFSGRAGRLAAQAQEAALVKGQGQANDALDTAYGQASNAYGQAGNIFGGLTDSYGAGSKLYQDALGVNGKEGAGAAQSAFTSSPGYSFNLDQGMQALQRTRAASGTLASGNADTDAMKFSQGLASQDWNNWLQNLSGLDTKRYGATTGEAGTFGQLGSAALGVGQAKAGIATQTAQGIGTAQANGLMAGQQAAANRFGAMMGGLNLVANGVGSLAGNGNAMGNLGKNLSSAFSIFG
ncbi:hypothetical protein [Methylobacterium sp. E-045]|uniref:hypothetical protein n=1 Tax=Methylobacterium sp. E-045 TaxID=2836575 RepID=UPI001FB9B071|nr:hypothetical protein [Methylobacterium sp. E-045]MCJ2129219.1 hypothetical protein [Methylobacterium sp. E-045]